MLSELKLRKMDGRFLPDKWFTFEYVEGSCAARAVLGALNLSFLGRRCFIAVRPESVSGEDCYASTSNI
jgi:hypothetical protein